MASMRKGSIAVRLFWVSAIWLVVALSGTALLLTELYSRALDNGMVEQLEFHLSSLVSKTNDTSDPANVAVDTPDPRFLRPGSGWYWLIRDEKGNVLNASPSVLGLVLPQLTGIFDGQQTRTAVERDTLGTRIRMIERENTVKGQKLRIVVTGNLDEISQLANDFGRQAVIVLGAVGVMLAIMSAIGARIMLFPINRLRSAVVAVREGETERVVGTFPYEIAPLAEEVNALLRSNTGIIERSRSQVGNLAHGLKTPIAVIRNETAGKDSELARIVLSEADKMQQIVMTYLDQARHATKIVGQKTDATKALTRLVRVMTKVHPSRKVTMDPPPDNVPWFRGGDSDFEEMVGNLLDNACKWSKSEVRASLADDTWAGSRALKVSIEDDGKGLNDEEAKEVLRRGVRLDEKTPGSGLGLDIVKELVDVYGGGFVLGRSSLGGLRADLLLPAARPAPKPIPTGPRSVRA